MTRVWLMNLTAELELESPGSSPPRAARRAAARFAARAAAALVPEGDLIWDGEAPLERADVEGRSFSPTPRALKAFAGTGVATPPAPSVDILRAANDRAFCADLGQTLPGAHDIRSREELRLGDGEWLLKRAFGFAGRGQHFVRVPLTEADERWLAKSLTLAGVQVEPRVLIDLEVGTPGFIRTGEVLVGQPVEQLCEGGVWRESRPGPVDVPTGDLRESARHAGEALRELGYFGPFGVDAYRCTLRSLDEARWNLRSEINARYTMGWALGWQRRPDL